MRTFTRVLTAVLGVVMLIAAAVLSFVVVPDRAQLPEDTDSTRTYEGQVATLLNADALASGDLGNVVLRDLPVTIEQQVEVTAVDGGTADVTDASTVTLPDGTPLLQTASTYVVDRKSMSAQGDADGLVIGWPVNPEAVDTTVWSGSLQTAVPAVYEATEEHAGIETLRFTAVESGRIVDAAWLETVPTSVPSGLLGILATALDAPAAVMQQLGAAGESLPVDVPLAYLVEASTTYWVHPTTGMVIDADVAETRSVVLDVPGMETTPVAPVLDLAYQGEADSVAATVAEADDLAGQLSLFGSIIPVALTAVGFVLVLPLAFRRRSRTEIDLTGDDDSSNTSDDQPTPTASAGSTR